MKKAVVLLLVVVVAVGALLLLRPGAVDTANAATIAVLRGDVEAQHTGGSFGPALDGDVLFGGDVVRANAQGRAVLTFFDGSTLSVEPGSQVTVKSLARTSGDGLQVVIEQTLGRTWASVQKLKTPDSHFELRTPSSTAVVRGTTFETTVEVVNGVTITTVKTGEGEVVVQAVSGGEVSVPAGTQVQVQQNQPAPSGSTPQPPAPRLRFAATPGVGFTVIDPRGLSCGSTGLLRQIPRCDVTNGVVTVGEVVAGTYAVSLTAAVAAPDGALSLQGFRGAIGDFSIGLVRALAVGDLVRTTTNVSLGADGRLAATNFTAAEQVTSICGAEAAGRVFSSGSLDERSAALTAFGNANHGQPAAFVLTSAELTAAAAKGAADVGGPATLSNIAVTAGPAGIHMTGQAAVGPLSLGANADIIAGASGGKLVMKVRALDLGVVPAVVKDQLVAAIESQLGAVANGFPLNVERVALRSGCVGVMGTTR